MLTGTSPELALLKGAGHLEEHLERRLRAHERYLAEAGPAAGSSDVVRRSGALWFAEAEGAFRAAVWAAGCVARVRACEREALQAVRDAERRQRKLRAMNPISRWLKTPPAGVSEHSERISRARADLEKHARILRREYPLQIGLMQKAGDPLLDGFFEQCLLLTYAAAERVAAYASAEEGALAGLIDARLDRMVATARGVEAG